MTSGEAAAMMMMVGEEIIGAETVGERWGLWVSSCVSVTE